MFVNEPAELVERILKVVPLDVLQFHGDESADYCQQFDRPYMKALRMAPDMDPVSAASPFQTARAVLLDSWEQGVPGGTGKTFDWQRAGSFARSRLVLAGGLDPENVGEAISLLKPAGVDVSGGVESTPGVKDPQRVAEFIAAVKAADST